MKINNALKESPYWTMLADLAHYMRDSLPIRTDDTYVAEVTDRYLSYIEKYKGSEYLDFMTTILGAGLTELQRKYEKMKEEGHHD